MSHHYPAGEQPASWVPGSVVFTHSKGLVGSLIRLGQKLRLCGWRPWCWKAHPNYKWCHYNHVVLVTNTGGGIIEALADGVVSPSAGMTKYLNAEYTVWEFDPQFGSVAYGLGWLLWEFKRHVTYGWASIASIVLQVLTGTKLSISYKDSIICSGLGACYIEHTGGCLPYDDPKNVMPAELAKFLAVSV